MSARTIPMPVRRVRPFVDRIYRQSEPGQFIRELVENSRPAGATHMVFGVQWDAVENGIRDSKNGEIIRPYRLDVWDNGSGITRTDFPRFINEYGGGGKTIGGPHDYYGIGMKTSTLPWNPYGIVIRSLYTDQASGDVQKSMAWIHYDAAIDDYGLRVIYFDDGDAASVYEPFDDIGESGVDWSNYPDWVEEAGHGFGVTFLGSNPQADTVLGPADHKMGPTDILRYVNRRFWELNGLRIDVEVLTYSEREKWPKSVAEARGRASSSEAFPTDADDQFDRKVEAKLRPARGALYHVEETNYEQDRKTQKGWLAEHGDVIVGNGDCSIAWFLRGGQGRDNYYAETKTGYFAVEYANELYHQTTHIATMRQWGVPHDVADRVVIVARPQVYDEDSKKGVYPNDARSALLFAGANGKAGAGDLPLAQWQEEFRSKLPEAIHRAIAEVRADQDAGLAIADDSWKERLQNRFGHLWRIAREQPVHPPEQLKRKPERRTNPRYDGRGTHSGTGPAADPGIRDGLPRKRRELGAIVPNGTHPSRSVSVPGGLPDCRTTTMGNAFAGEWSLAAWERPQTKAQPGIIWVNLNHEVLIKHVREYQEQYPSHDADDVRRVVIDAYRELAVAHVAHCEEMRCAYSLTEEQRDEWFFSDYALTMALLGMMGPEAVIRPRLARFKRIADASA